MGGTNQLSWGNESIKWRVRINSGTFLRLPGSFLRLSGNFLRFSGNFLRSLNVFAFLRNDDQGARPDAVDVADWMSLLYEFVVAQQKLIQIV